MLAKIQKDKNFRDFGRRREGKPKKRDGLRNKHLTH